MKVSKQKVAKLSPAAQKIMNSKNEFELAFDQIKNIIFKVQSFKIWSENVGFLNYKKLVLSTLKNKDSEDKMKYIKGHCAPYLRLYNTYRESILEEDMGFLTNKNEMVNLTAGKSGQAILPLSEIYIHLQKTNEDAMEDLEGKLLLIFLHLTGPDSDDRKRLEKICAQYEMNEDMSTAKTIGGIVNAVKDSGLVNKIDPNAGELSFADMGPLVQQIMGNKEMQASMGNLASDLMTGKLDIPTLVGQVKNAGIIQERMNKSHEEEDEETDEDDDE